MFFDYTLTILSFFVIVYAFNPAYAQTLLIPELLPAPVAIPQDADKVIKAFSSTTTEEKNDNDYGIYDWDSYNSNKPVKQESEIKPVETTTIINKPISINQTQLNQINDILTMQQIIAKDMFFKSISNSSSLGTQLTPQQVQSYNNIFNKPINSFSNNGTKTDSTLPLPTPSQSIPLEAVAVKAPIDNQSSRTTVLEQSQQLTKQLSIEPKSVQMQDSLPTVKTSPQIKTTALEPEPESESEEIRTFASDAAKAIDKDTDVKVEPQAVPAEFKPQQQEQPSVSLPNPNTTNNTDNAPSKPTVAGGLVAGQANTTKQLFDQVQKKTEETTGIVERGVRDTQKWFSDTGEMLGHLGKQIQDIGLQIYNIYAAISAGIVTFLIFLVAYVINRFVKNTKRKWHIIKDWFAKDTEDIDKNGTPDTKWIPERDNKNTQAVNNYVRPHINTHTHVQTNGKKKGKNPSFAKQMARNTIGDIMRNTMSKRDDYNDERFSRFMDNQEREYRQNNNNSSIRPNDSRLDRWGYSAR